MDERDLYVPVGAGNAEQHQQPREPTDLDEFDPLASVQHHHDLDAVPEQKPGDFDFDPQPTHVDFDEGRISSKPKHEDEPKPKEPETPVDNANEEIIERRHHAPLTDETSQEAKSNLFDQPDYNEIGKNLLHCLPSR